MESKTYQRRNYFIDKKFQGRFIGKFSALVLMGGVLTIAVLYQLGTQSKTVAIENSRVVATTTADFILPLLVQTVIIVTVVVGITAALLTLLASHRISGPLYRFRKVLEALEQGDFSSSEFHIRSGDQFHDLADEMNRMIRATRQEMARLKHSTVSLKQKLDTLDESDLPEHKRVVLAELEKIAEEFDRAIRYFKI